MLITGSRLGPCEIIAPLGAGGILQPALFVVSGFSRTSSYVASGFSRTSSYVASGFSRTTPTVRLKADPRTSEHA